MNGNREWYLRANDETFGPESRERLVEWARMGRILPGQELSADGETWYPVTEVPFLDMRWSIDPGDGNPRGPFNHQAADALLKSGRLPRTAVLVETRAPFADDVFPPVDEVPEKAAVAPEEPVGEPVAAEDSGAGDVAPEESAAEVVETVAEEPPASNPSAEAAAKAALAAAHAQLESARAAFAAEKAKFESEKRRLENEFSHLEVEKAKLAGERRELEEKAKALAAERTRLTAELESTRSAADAGLAEARSAAAEELKSARNEAAVELAAAKAEATAELATVRAEATADLAKARAEAAEALAKVKAEAADELLKTKTAAADELAQTQAGAAAAQAQAKEAADAELAKSRSETAAAREEADGLRRQLEELRARTERDGAALQAKLNETEAQRAALEGKVAETVADREKQLALADTRLRDARADVAAAVEAGAKQHAADAAALADANDRAELAAKRVADAERQYADLLEQSNRREKEYQTRITHLGEELQRVPPDSAAAAAATAAIYELMQMEADDIARALEQEKRDAENARQVWLKREDRLLARRRELLKKIGDGPSNMLRRAVGDMPDSPKTVRLQEELDTLKQMHEQMMHEADRRLREAAEKISRYEADLTRMRASSSAGTMASAQMQQLRDQLAKREQDVVELRRQVATAERAKAVLEQTMQARIRTIEGSPMLPNIETNQSAESKHVRLAAWMGFRR